MLHDLHHVATGFGTDMIGEGEVSVWETRRRLRPLGQEAAAVAS
jgi:ubiquinone biosynthesis protein Coq4